MADMVPGEAVRKVASQSSYILYDWQSISPVYQVSVLWIKHLNLWLPKKSFSSWPFWCSLRASSYLNVQATARLPTAASAATPLAAIAAWAILWCSISVGSTTAQCLIALFATRWAAACSATTLTPPSIPLSKHAQKHAPFPTANFVCHFPRPASSAPQGMHDMSGMDIAFRLLLPTAKWHTILEANNLLA